LPGQTVESFTDTVREAAEIRPDRLVTFSYAHVPWLKKHQVILEKKGLPLPEEKMNIFLSAYRLLTEKGYVPVGLDHFVLPGDDLYIALKEHKLHRNFMGYCTRRTTGQVYAFGVTAISQIEKGYSQNKKDIAGYIKDVEAGILPVEKGCLLTREQRITREVITEIMCNKRIDLSETAGKEGISVNELKMIVGFSEEKFDDFVNDGIVVLGKDIVKVTETGSFFIRNVAALFDRDYQEKKQPYSKIV
jgi:oxygen-independent coproporphyrinogen-3 oxidase